MRFELRFKASERRRKKSTGCEGYFMGGETATPVKSADNRYGNNKTDAVPTN
jgi:hypothetical protein